MKHKGWDEFTAGACLFSFDGHIEQNPTMVYAENRPYSENNSFNAKVGDWRVIKPIWNEEFCIHCQFCWIYCPDISIISRDKKFNHIDYKHCKGCGVCVDVCPTNPKSLLMFDEFKDNNECLANWPKKDEKDN